MIRYNLRVAFRSLLKKRVFAAINIGGLAIGLSAVLVIGAYLREELSYDEFNVNKNEIYRITEEYRDDAKQVHSALNHGPVAELISHQLSGLKSCVRILPYPAYVTADKVEKHREKNIVFADSTFFDVFSFHALSGNLSSALSAPFSVVLTESMAMKYFGSVEVVGRELHYEDERAMFTYHVAAVIRDVPQNSHFTFDFVFNMTSLRTVMPWFNSWHYPPMYIYIHAEKGLDIDLLRQNIQRITDQHSPEQIKAEKRKYYVQRLSDIHFYSFLANEWQGNTNVLYIRIFSGVAIFLLVIACVNFMNLSTAQSTQRAREVGVRKVMGAFPLQLVRQFLGEAFLISLISILIALGIAELLLMTVFRQLMDKDLSLLFLLNGYNILWLLALLVFITVLAGLYPAFYLSRHKPVLALKGRTERIGSMPGLRRVLVVFQFFISALLLIGTMVVLEQSHLLRNKNLGFEEDALVTIKLVDRYAASNYNQLKNSFLQKSGVVGVALSSEIPGGENFYGLEVNPEGFPKNAMSMNSLGMDEDFASTFNITLITGRSFSVDIPSDGTQAVLLNESAVKFLGWTPESAIGKSFELTVYTSEREHRKGQVVGVTRDFHYQSLHNRIEPLVMYINKHPYYSDFLTIRTSNIDLLAVTGIVRAAWKEFHPEKPAEFFFLNDSLQKQYQAESRISSIFSAFAILSVAISCLGLFGLSAFSAQRRTKEIGIRKVLGANVSQIVSMLSREYLGLILLANAIAWPVAYFASAQWLETFPYRVDVGVGILFGTLLFALIVALLTVSIQSIKAALVNPVKTLRSE
jgi:putative ABC transport system permease protein